MGLLSATFQVLVGEHNAASAGILLSRGSGIGAASRFAGKFQTGDGSSKERGLSFALHRFRRFTARLNSLRKNSEIGV
jgi:hypothetical protein